METTITHTCGCTRTVRSNGLLRSDTVRFLANSRCLVCGSVAGIRAAKTPRAYVAEMEFMAQALTPVERAEVEARLVG